MKISVVITTHNRAALLREAIESVLSQEPCGAEIELIVVDDDSTDETPAVTASYPTARYERTKQGTAAGSRNVGIGLVQGEWIAFLDDDDVWLPRKLAVCVQAMQQNPDARMLFSAAVICDHHLVRGALWQGPNLTRHANAFDAFLDDIITPSVVLLRRSVFEEVGVFDASPALARVEDREFWYRVTARGVACAAIADPLVLYRLRPKIAGDLLAHDAVGTLRVLRSYLTPANALRPSWRRCQQVLWRVRGWYAHQLCEAAAQSACEGNVTLQHAFRREAWRLSPLHVLKYRISHRASRLSAH